MTTNYNIKKFSQYFRNKLLKNITSTITDQKI